VDPLTAAGAALAAVHFTTPLAYYATAKRWLRLPWGVRRDPAHTPTVTVAIPTYNKAGHIEEKLDDVYRQDYPRDKLEIIVVDSASTDGTAEKARRWAAARQDIDVKVIEEPERRGKAAALNKALAEARGEIFVITDADCRWPQRDALRRAASWLADPTVSAVTCLKTPAANGPAGVEAAYREHYNVLRLAESKKWATPVFHGELAAYRTELLRRIGGFPPRHRRRRQPHRRSNRAGRPPRHRGGRPLVRRSSTPRGIPQVARQTRPAPTSAPGQDAAKARPAPHAAHPSRREVPTPRKPLVAAGGSGAAGH